MNRLHLFAGLLNLLFLFQCNHGLSQISFPGFEIINFNNSNSGYYIFAISNKMIIMDNFGTPVFCRQVAGGVLDFNKQEDDYLYYYATKGKKFYKLDSCYRIIDTIKIKNDYDIDYHKILVKKNGDIYLLGHQYHLMDLRDIFPGGKEFTTVVEDIIQVLDKNKNVKFEWKSLEHISILDTDTNYVNLASNVVDYMHINSFDTDENENIYISARHLNEIIKVNGATGDVIWRLGGKKNEFTLLGDESFFSGQHSIKVLTGGKILLFDNGNIFHPTYSLGKEYIINEDLKTVELLHKFQTNPNIFVPIMGNIQQAENDHIAVGWGKNNEGLLLTEYDSSNNLILKFKSTDQLYSYSITKIGWKTGLLMSNLDTIDFSNVEYGQSSVKNITISNNSDKEIELSGYSTHDTIFKIRSVLPTMVAPRGTSELIVGYNPSRYGGVEQDILTVNSDGLDEFGDLQRIAIQVQLKGYSNDINPPVANSYPLNNSINIPIKDSLVISFDEPVRFIDHSELTIDQVKNCFNFKTEGSNNEILFDIKLNDINDTIWIFPTSLLGYNKKYILNIYPYFEDYSKNIIEEKQIHFTTELATNIKKDLSLLEKSIFPNPASEEIIIHNNSFIKKIEMMDSNGKILKSIDTFSGEYTKIRINEQPPGIYYILKKYEKGIIKTEKFLKF
jgi:hypothetical protein